MDINPDVQYLEDEADLDKNRMSEKLQALGYGLQKKIDDRVGRRSQIEERWLNDLKLYHGYTDLQEKTKLTDAKKSTVFANIIHNKTNGAEARMVDIVSPTDARNWSLKPTPIPEIADMKSSGEVVMDNETGQPIPADVAADVIVTEAKKRSDAMSKEIDDQLTESYYQAVCRDVIHDGVVLGTGVFKGPIVVGRTRKSWQQTGDVHILEMVNEVRPGCERVSPWDFFPDTNARRIEDAEDVYERKLLNRKQLRALAKNPGYLVDQIELLLTEGPQKTTAYGNLDMLREITGAGTIDYTELYEIWEYHGNIDREDLIAAGVAPEDMPDSPLEEYPAVIVFCNGKVVRASLNPMETGELPYSVWCWETDETSIFGFGVPHRGRDSQEVINAAWRMIMDNSGMSVGPQIIMDKDMVEPADGRYEIVGRKLWYKTDRNKSVNEVFGIYHIDGHQTELANIFQMARQLADEETNLPLIAQGEQSENVTDTAQGMGMLMQAATVVFRRAVRSWDDNMTTRTIKRFYDWNMQNSKNPEIKGDFEIQARGVAYLSELEFMEKGIQDLVAMAVSPIFGPMTNMHELYKRVCKAKKIDPDGLVIEEADMQQQEQGPPPEVEVEMMKLKQERELAEMRMQQEYQIAMAKIAADEGTTVRDLEAQLGLKEKELFLKNKEIDTKRQIAGVQEMSKQNELAFKAQTGRQGI